MHGSVALLLQTREEVGQGVSSAYVVEHLSDAELLASTRGLVARSNHQLACLLAHLAEVEARGIYRERACSSLCTYCIYELRLSEDTAFRYARVARLGRKFPILFQQIAAGEVHLSGVLALGPHLTDENHRDVLQLAKHRSKREIMKLVRRLDPLPDVPPRIEPLGPPGGAQPLRRATWSSFMDSLNPVRELRPEDRPSNWVTLGREAESDYAACEPSKEDFSGVEAVSTVEGGEASDTDRARSAGTNSQAPRGDKPPWLDPQRYSVQFTASQEYADLVERARNLLSHAVPDRSIADIHLRAMRLLVAHLEKRRFAVGCRQPTQSRSRNAQAAGNRVRTEDARNVAAPSATDPDVGEPDSIVPGAKTRGSESIVPGAKRRGSGEPDISTPSMDSGGGSKTCPADSHGRRAGGNTEEPDSDAGALRPARCLVARRVEDELDIDEPSEIGRDTLGTTVHPSAQAKAMATRGRQGEPSGGDVRNGGGRYIPGDVRRQVYRRDGGRCAYVSPDGQRCREVGFLQFQHHEPHVRGGAAVVPNLALYCRSHNALAAERDFGRSYMARRSGRE